ncbi:MAG: biotin biosynthesis protein BioC [Verrucomicrobia bacterium]|nr:biotin biosynthesis protein BioC [Verrucomicrobiota bacterium]
MKPLADFNHLPLNRAVSARDTMVWPGMEQQYFDLGHRALELVNLSAQLCDKPHYPKILDLPCGHGRVLRWLQAHYNYARITACDLDRDAVDFCRDQFGATGVYSQRDLRALPFTAQFDLVWCGSLLTHLRAGEWLTALDCLIRWTSECGVIVFTTQGRFFASLLARGQDNIAENVDKAALLKKFAEHGNAFEPYFEDADQQYGVAVTAPEYIGRVLQRYPNVIIRAYLEQAWGIQDVVILYKKAGYFEPLLVDKP